MEKYPHTLDSDLQMRQPGSDFGAMFFRNNELELPIGGKTQVAQAALLVPMLSDQIDIKAPGVREHMMNPPISFGPFRSSAYDQQRPVNQAPIPNYEDVAGGEQSMMFGDWAMRTGAANYLMLNENKVQDHQSNQFRNLSQWSQSLTGVSALRDFRPISSLRFI